MKNHKLNTGLLIVLLFGLFGNFSNAQDQSKKNELTTAKFKVYGACGMCKTRIEKACKVEGITKANWDMDSQMLTVNYDKNKITEDKIHKLVAAVGHDTDKEKAKDEVYNKLPQCCQYERKK